MLTTRLTEKTCICGRVFMQQRPMQNVCSKICALRKVRSEKKAKEKAEREDVKRRKEAIKTRREWLADAKKAVQAFRREEELAKGRGCMSCGRTQAEVMDGPWQPGGCWDGGHFLSKGARPELALEPKNIWLQCKSCNGGSGKYARKGYTVAASFEANLIEDEGLELVEWLKGPHEPKHYTIDWLKEFTTDYRRKLRELKAGP